MFYFCARYEQKGNEHESSPHRRTDGQLVTMYYYNTREHPEMHIAYTVWHPDEILKSNGVQQYPVD